MNTTCCDQASLNPLKNLDEAILELQKACSPDATSLQIESIPLSDALNRILAVDIYSDLNVPPADNSAVDGYALNFSTYITGQTLRISQRIAAGHAPKPLEAGTAARIFTGAHVPEGANCVVMQENVNLSEDKLHLSFSEPLKEGQNIRPLGQDIAKGNNVLSKGLVVSPQRLGLLASIGVSEVMVYKPLKVAILSTGDELVEPGNALREGQIFNSNRYLLNGFLKALNFEILDLGIIPDDSESTLAALSNAAQNADIVITTGGASVGEEDYIQSAIETLGKLDFWKVAIKPGKPVMLGNIDATPIIGLPGNPGAVFVTFMILARPCLLHKQGLTNTLPKAFTLPIDFDIKRSGIRREFLRVIRTEENLLQLHSNQSSGMLSSASWAEGLAIIMENTCPKKGDLVKYIPFESLLNLNN